MLGCLYYLVVAVGAMALGLYINETFKQKEIRKKEERKRKRREKYEAEMAEKRRTYM